ncbi:FAD-dependent oxidoreductase [Labrys okinawensis]|uniref:FAD-dependent oxidoreductase n=1 Tax=Labrys okinawensis TaxID=346911 RepID=UPI0039BD4AD9
MLTFQFEGRALTAAAGETIAAALMANGEVAQTFARNGEPRGLHCGMGVCHDCLVVADGRAGVRACMTKVTAGMKVGRQPSKLLLGDHLVDAAPSPEGPLLEETVDLLIVGAGPGGLAAAEVAGASGASVLIVDERPAPGGQFFKQPASGSALTPRFSDRQSQDGSILIRSVRALGVEIRSQTLIWGAFREDGVLVLGLFHEGRASYLRPKILIIASGAFEQPGTFPGWTLPGVVTTGACQTLLRSHGVLPGKRILIAGNGPLNLQVADELAHAGAQVIAVAEAAPPPWTRPRAALKLMAADATLAVAGLRHLSRLARRGITVHWGHRLARVEGGVRAENAVLVDAAGRERVFAVDAVGVGEAFSPANELVRLLGCAHVVKADGPPRAETKRDDAGATSLDDVFVVGEAGGFGGAQVAMAQARLAASEAVRRLGRQTREDAASRRRLARNRRFQGALWKLFAAPEPGLSRVGDDTHVCRCETLSLGNLRRVIEAEHVADIATLKRLTRAGMGRCQGRYCIPRLAQLLGGPTLETEFPAPQMPLRPIPLAALAVEKPEWAGHRRALLPPAVASVAGSKPLPFTEVSVLVIGAGIAGLSTALFLARHGREVVVLDRGYANARASGGNAGSLHAQLLSFDHGARAEGGGSPAARTLPLQRDSIALWAELERELHRDFEMRITGGLMVAENQRDLAFLVEKTRVEQAHGIDCQMIDASTLRGLEPALSDGFLGAAFCPQEGKINPLIATQGVLEGATAAGAKLFERVDVMAIERGAAGFVVHTSRGSIRAGVVVNAAGAFASQIGRMLGTDVPVFGAPLQMVVTEAVEPLVSRLVAHADRHLTLKQAANGNFIIGGGWTAGLDPIHHHPRPLRASLEGNLWVAQHVVPALRKLHIIRSWAAMNVNIDGAPILGENPGIPGFFNAVASNGYTLGPLVGRITADLICRGETDRDVSAFSISRFRN